jgi:putative membrane-bound dehydrogenase-like protein
MKRLAPIALGLIVAAWVLAAVEPKPDAPKVELNGHAFTLPEGFEIELVAGPPLVEHPISAAFDEQGRLYVTEALGSNDKIDVQLQKKPYRILRLESSKGDGRFDKRTVFVDRIMFTEGAMWFDGSLYVAAPPSICKLTDTKDTGIADQQVEWFQGKTVTGCANDLHGPYLGPDGWIYWCKGAFAKQTYERPGKPPFVTRASHIFRSRPDGSGLEPVMTGGMDNPVGVAFTPGGERIFTTTFFQHPAEGKRDGLIHAIYGGVYGKDHDVIYEHKWTSPALMPVLTHLGPAAPCGLTRYESDIFGKDYQDSLFACLFNLHKVTRHVLIPDGATFKTRDEDFVVSASLDFHPTDVLEDADGSLLVIDTGGWYKLCCPTSQLHKPDALGAIYRVRKKAAPRVEDPRGLKLAWPKLSVKELAGLLDDARPAVQHRAMEALAKQGADAVPTLAELIRSSKSSARARRNAVWIATRIDDTSARAAVRAALADDDEVVRQAAIHSVSVRRDHNALPALLKLLAKSTPHNRRAAAEAIGRLGDKAAVPALLDAAGEPTDRALEHSVTYALIEIADREKTAGGLKAKSYLTRRAALVALDQMDGGGLDAATVMPDLTSTTPVLRETATWIVGRHPEWAGELVGYFRDRLNAKELPDAERDELVRQLARFARAKPIQDLLADRLQAAGVSANGRRLSLRAMALAGLKEAPGAWIDAVAGAVDGHDPALTGEAVATARAIVGPKQRSEKLTAALLRVANNDEPPQLRLRALAAVPGGLVEVKPDLFAFLLAHADRERTVAERSLAADVLSHAILSGDQLLALADALKDAGPMEVDRLLEAFKQSTDERVGLRVLAALDASPIRSSLRIDMIKPRLEKYSPAVQRKAEELYAVLNTDAAKQKEHLEKLFASLEKGDPQRGQLVFNSQKVACMSCHTVGYVGGKIGPDLTRVGAIRTERDLLESIVYPSNSFVRSYEPVEITTKKGKTYNGVVRKDSLDEIVLALDATNEVRVARNDIDEMKPGKVSIMPAGLDKQLTPRELADLIAFLKACK